MERPVADRLHWHPDIALMYLVARHLFRSDFIAAIAAGLLALTPAHFIHSRYGMDYVYPVPFILAWLLCLVLYNEKPRTWLLVLGSSILGIGFYCYISSIVMMPLYFVSVPDAARAEGARQTFVLAAAGFVRRSCLSCVARSASGRVGRRSRVRCDSTS